MKKITLPKDCITVKEKGNEVEIEFNGLTCKNKETILEVLDLSDSEKREIYEEFLTLDQFDNSSFLEHLIINFNPEDLVETDLSWNR